MCVYLPSLVDGLAPSTSGCSLNYGQDRRWIPWCAAFDPMCFCGGGQKSILFAVVKDHQTGLGRSHVSTVEVLTHPWTGEDQSANQPWFHEGRVTQSRTEAPRRSSCVYMHISICMSILYV